MHNEILQQRGGDGHNISSVIGLIPTGWYPNSISLNAPGSRLYVVNGKSNAGPNLLGCRNTTPIALGSLDACLAANEYVWQLTKAGFLIVPTPNKGVLKSLTLQVARNNNYDSGAETPANQKIISVLHNNIQHVIYIVKENRTFDQVLGDLSNNSNGVPSLAILGGALSPNHHQIASQFVTLDNFYDSGDLSGDGWN